MRSHCYHLTIQLLNTLIIGWLGLCFLLAAIALGLAAQIINITFNDYNVYAGADLNFLLYRGTGPVLAIAIAAITTLTLPIL